MKCRAFPRSGFSIKGNHQLQTMRRGSLAGFSGSLRSNMKSISSLAVVTALVALGFSPRWGQAADEEGVGVAIVYDTSGSRQEWVREMLGRSTRKYLTA